MFNNVSMRGFPIGGTPEENLLAPRANPPVPLAAQPASSGHGTKDNTLRLTCARDLLALLLQTKTGASWNSIKDLSCEAINPQNGKIELRDSIGQVTLAGEALTLLSEYLDLRQGHTGTQTGPLIIDTRTKEMRPLTGQSLGIRSRMMRNNIVSGAADRVPADLKSLYFATIESPVSVTVRSPRTRTLRSLMEETPSSRSATRQAETAREHLAVESLLELATPPTPQSARATAESMQPTLPPYQRVRALVEHRAGGAHDPAPALPTAGDDWSSVPRDGMVELLQRAGFRPIHAIALSANTAALQEHLGEIDETSLASPSPDGHKTALHHAVEGGNLDNLRQLLDAIAQSETPWAINHQDAIGLTPLHLAGHIGNIDAFKLLLKAGGEIIGPSIHTYRLTANAVDVLTAHLLERYQAEQQLKHQHARDQARKRSLNELLSNT